MSGSTDYSRSRRAVRAACPGCRGSQSFTYQSSPILPEDLHRAWVAELAGLLRPGGVLVATTLGWGFVESAHRMRTIGDDDAPWKRAVIDSFPDPEAAAEDYEAGHFLFAPYPASTATT